MALSASTVWEVQVGGNDTFGGGFVAGSGGTDRSQQTTAQVVIDNATITATCSTTVVTFTGGTYTVLAGDVGNIVNMISGTSLVAGWYQITAVSAGLNGTWTLDRTTGMAGAAVTSAKMGGCLASVGNAGKSFVAGNIVWIKAGTYSITSATANVAGGCITMAGQAANANQGRIIGYQTTRGDGGTKPLLQASGISTFTILTLGTGNHAENLSIDGALLTSGRGMNGANGRAYNCKTANCTNFGISGGMLIGCEAVGCSGANGGMAPQQAFHCISHDNVSSCAGFFGSFAHIAIDCIAYGNSGTGFDDAGAAVHWMNCTSYGNAGNGFTLAAGTGSAASDVYNIVSYGNTGWGISSSANVGTAVYNSFLGSNTAGAVTGSVTVVGQVNLSANPFTNSAGGDFSLNNTAGGGASVRAAALPGAFTGSSTTSYLDGGAAQHQDSGGAAGMLFIPNLDGL